MKTQLYYFAKGHMGQYEDWWYLVQETGNDPYVEHEWDHVRVNGGGSDKGAKRHTIDEARRQAPGTAITKMDEILSASK